MEQLLASPGHVCPLCSIFFYIVKIIVTYGIEYAYIFQQTISQAVAAKYPRTMHQSSNAIGVRHLGHNGKTPVQTHNIQSIKVVE